MNRKQRRAAISRAQTPPPNKTSGSRPKADAQHPKLVPLPATNAGQSPETITAAKLLKLGLEHQQSGRVVEAESCYQRVLAAHPNHADALHLLGLLAHQSKRVDEAIDLINRAIAQNRPGTPIYLTNLGVLFAGQGKYDAAIECYDKALGLDSKHVEAHSNRAAALTTLKRFEDALASYDKVLALKPNDIKALENRIALLGELGRHEEALTGTEKLLAIQPDHVGAYNNRGAALDHLKRFDEALASYERALSFKPDDVATLNNKGNTLQKLGRLDEALSTYDKLLTRMPDYIMTLNNKGNVLRKLGRHDEALACYDKVLSIDSNHAEAYSNRGAALYGLKRFDEALASFNKALALKPDDLGALSGRANVLNHFGQREEALICCEKALSIDPKNLEALISRGVILSELTRFDEALVTYEKAISIDPSLANAHWNESLLRLTLGDFERGWTKHEWRWKAAVLSVTQRDFNQPAWLGNESIEGKRVLIYNEQGSGDAIQFCRYIPLLAAQGAHVIVETPDALRPLMSGLAGVAQCISTTEKIPEFDFHCSVNSLPVAFKTQLVTIPANVPYLHPPAQSDEWETRLGRKDRPRIGLVWSGNPKHGNDHNRSASLRAILPLLDADATFVNLLKDVRPEDEALLKERSDILNFGPTLKNFGETAALISHLDLVISVDTSVAHLAGALGKPVWILLPFIPDWRWLLDREDSPWYPTARLFRQDEGRAWPSVIERVRNALGVFIENPNSVRLKPSIIPHVPMGNDAHAPISKPIQNNELAPENLISRGTELAKQKKYEEALSCYDKAIALKPEDALVYTMRANVLDHLNRHEEALANFDQALSLRPDFVAVYNDRGNLLRKLKRPDEALADFDKASAILRNSEAIVFNKGLVYLTLGRPNEALASFDRALALSPNFTEAINARGLALRDLKRFDEALACFERILATDPNHANANWNESRIRRLLGDFERGWAKAEWRWKASGLNLSHRNFKQPLWLGNEPVKGKVILLHSDEGLGDAIQFCRYIPLLAAQGAHVIVEVQEPLLPLLSKLPGVSQCLARGMKLPDFDLHCPISSLPLAFKTQLNTIPSAIPYLHVPANSESWEARLGHKDRPRIGLVWSGNQNYGNDRERSVALSSILSILDIDATFISLQKDVRPNDRALLSERNDILDLGPSLKNFADTAAVISQLDLVISVDTSVAHLAGALGKPVWILLPYVPDWRWMLDREDSPWYPTARLFRQDDSRAWPSVIERVRETLQEFVGSQGAPTPRIADKTPAKVVTSPPHFEAKPNQSAAMAAELCNRGVMLTGVKRFDEALTCYEQALLIDINYADAHLKESLTRLLLGDFERGLAKLEWRWKTPTFTSWRPDYPRPLWTGDSSIKGKRILIYNEQGHGDAIQFCRYVPLLATQGAQVIFVIEAPLYELMSDLKGVSELILTKTKLPDFDLHCSINSLPLAFNTRLETIPSIVPYLSAPTHSKPWVKRLGRKDRPRIGLVWSGNQKTNPNRSVALRLLAPLFENDATFVSLQKDVLPGDESALKDYGEIINLGPSLKNFADTAAVISQLDLVISVDTSVAHLAGALGKPVWILLPYVPDWRWMLDREDSPWYPTARLFRQDESRAWPGVIERVGVALGEFVKKQNSSAAKITITSAHVQTKKIESNKHEVKGQLQLKHAPATTPENRPIATSELLKIGVNHLQSSRLVEAEASFRRVLAAEPDHADALHMLGLVVYQTKRYDTGIDLINQAIAKNGPGTQLYLTNLSTLLVRQGKHQQAIECYDKIVTLKPDDAKAWLDRANALSKLRRFGEALESCDKALALKPDHVEAINGRSAILRELGRFDEALACCASVLKLKPDYADAYNTRGTVLRRLNRNAEALVAFDRAIEIKPNFVAALNNRGNALQKLGRLDEALSSYDKALLLNPSDVLAVNNRTAALIELKRFDEAIAGFEKTQSLDPNNSDAHWNESLVRLTLGDFELGWTKYEWRWKIPQFNHSQIQNISQPYWVGGEPIEGKKILIYNEQGFGDAIQFCRYIPLLAAQGAHVIVQIDKALGPLMSTVAGVAQCISKGEQLPAFDLHCSINSLPLAFKTRLETIPSAIPYVTVPAQSEEWERRLGSKDRPRIGLVWSGRPTHGNDHNRSSSLRAFLPLLDVNATFVSLQKDPRPHDQALLSERKDILDLSPSFKDFADTAALISHLDLVITVDTAVAHLAGALSKPVWILLPFVPDWRWLLDREDSPWYPTARLFRQDESRAWPGVIERVRAALGEFVGPQGPTGKSIRGLSATHQSRTSFVQAKSVLVPLVPTQPTSSIPDVGIKRAQVGQVRLVMGTKEQQIEELPQTTLDSHRSHSRRHRVNPTSARGNEWTANDTVAELLKAGLQHHLSGRLAKAAACYRRALAAQPDQADALHGLGLIAYQSRHYDEAVRLIRQAIDNNGQSPTFFSNLGLALHGLGKYTDALDAYDKALALKPDYIEAHNNRALTLNKLRRFDEALTGYDKALSLKPDYVGAIIGRGAAFRELRRHEEAMACLDKALALDPNFSEAHNGRGIILELLKRYDEALASFDRALALEPGHVAARINRGNVLRRLERFDEAIANYNQALALEPNNTTALANRGWTLTEVKRFGEALANFEKAISIDSNYAVAHWNEANMRLLLGDLERGLAKAEWRWKVPTLRLQPPQVSQPAWLGNGSIQGKRILVYNEQGFGDAIQFCRYVPLLAAQGAEVIVQAQEPLRRLISGLAGVSQCIAKGEKLPAFDVHCSINSLPLGFKTRLETIPSATPYLDAPVQASDWEARLGTKDRPRVGLVWSGNQKHLNDHNRSASLRAFLALLQVDATFISLQKDARLEDQSLLSKRKDILDLGPSFKDFADTAAVISRLDLVITVDTSVAHLAGALGKPVWILLPFVPDWRWLLDREDSPWYPTARLFRQDESRAWPGVIESVRAALDEFVGPQGPRGTKIKTSLTTSNTTIAELLKIGIQHQQASRLAEAEACYRCVLAEQPDHANALHLLGVAAYQSQRYDEAVQLIRQAIAKNGQDPIYFSNLGLALHGLGKYADALDSYDKALALKSNYIEAYNNRAITFNKLRRFEDALASYDKALALKPDYIEAIGGRSIALRELKRYDEALAGYDKALALKPDHADSYNGRSIVLELLKRYDEALANCDRALALQPNFVAARINRANMLRRLDRVDEAIANYDRALALEPNNTLALSNRGWVLTEIKRFDEALTNFNKAISIDPHYAPAHWNEANARLLLGDFEHGWPKAEWRWKVPTLRLQPPQVSQPSWLGNGSIPGKRVLIYNEQGFGDAIQFCRYVPLLAAQGAEVIVQIQEPLRRLMSSLAGVSQCVTKGENLPVIDVHCSINSLPLAFKTRLETIPSTTPYLQAPVQTSDWEARLGSKDRPRIGLVWSGRPTHVDDRNRSAGLRAFLPLLDLDATFISLQKDIRPDDEALLKERRDILNFGSSSKDFSDTAALISQLDLVISVDTAVAHLAGALGKPVWILLPFFSDWRWLLDREDSPWYPTARLFRQDESRAWPNVIERVRAALREFVGSFPPSRKQSNITMKFETPQKLKLEHRSGKSVALTTISKLLETGKQHYEAGRLADAESCYQSVLAEQPGNPSALNLLGLVALKLKQHDRAIGLINRAMAKNGQEPAYWTNLGLVLADQGKYRQALECHDKALALKPDYAPALCNRAFALVNVARSDINRGEALDAVKQFEDAIAIYNKVTSIDPNYAIAYWYEAVTRLLLGDFERGWDKTEWRWKVPQFNLRRRNFTQPYWLGKESIKDKRILIYNEQGFGDAIQFCRYIPMLAAQGAKVVLEVLEPLQQLMSGLAGVTQCIAVTKRLPEFETRGLPKFDLHCSVNSLPLAFNTRLETIPSATPYLYPPAQTDNWEARLGRRDRPRIGLVWSGNPNYLNDLNRSIGLRTMLRLLDVDATFVSLQKDVRAEDQTLLNERTDILNLGPSLKNFADTAAVISQLDLVISVDTSVAHLAGALGKPVWILLPFVPDWRWMLDREDSPWYPTARLFRQDESRQWPSVIKRVQAALTEFVENYKVNEKVSHNDTNEIIQSKVELSFDRSVTNSIISKLLKAGVEHHRSGRLNEAEVYYRRILATWPDHIDALHLLGLIAHQSKRSDEAVELIKQAINNNGSDNAVYLANLGLILFDQGLYDKALDCCDRAITAEPDNADAHTHRGLALTSLKRFDEALTSYARAQSINPNHAEAQWDESLLRLLLGDFERGFAKYEWRWKRSKWKTRLRHFTQPTWLGGEPIKGKRILLYNDQGHGDAIQFCRYAPPLASQGAHVIVEVEEPLQQLISGLAGVSQCIAKGQTLPAFDMHCSFSSLPVGFKTRLETIPADTPYLQTPANGSEWQTRLGPEVRRIGLVWSGNPKHQNDRDRTAGLRAFLPLLDVDATFVSLQKDVRAEDQTVLNERTDILNLGPSLKNFADTAAVIAQLDLVISVDTAVAHLAGALGKPVWILLPYVPDWRWLLDRENSPWYPTARLFRQDESRAWPSVIERVRNSLAKLISK